MTGAERPGGPEAARPWALFLDVDGTLVDFAPRPDGVVIDGPLLELLKDLEAGLGGALALVSGRSLDDLSGLFGSCRFAMAGIHGAEWRLGGETGALLACDSPDCLRLALELGRLRTGLPDILIENKRQALALHWRSASQRRARVVAEATAAAARLGPGFRLLRGRRVVEILPAAAGKAGAIQRFMASPPFAGALPVFVGDDVTDESGFAAVNRLGGRSIRVGAGGVTAAGWRLAGVAAVRSWLAEVVCPALAGVRR